MPQVTVVHGSSTAGGAYLPGLSDYVVMVQGRAKVFLAGPPLLKAATGERRQRRGAGRRRDASDRLRPRRLHGRGRCRRHPHRREIVAKLHWNDSLPLREKRSFREPRYAPMSCCGVVPIDDTQALRRARGDRAHRRRLAISSSSRPPYGAAHRLRPCRDRGRARSASSATTGPIDAAGAVKAAQFIQLLLPVRHALVYLQNTTGYMVGTEAERRGIDQARLEDDPGRRQRQRAAAHPRYRRAASAPAITACAAAATIRASSSPGPTRAPR